MKFGVIGSGVVAQTLAAGLLKHGHQVAIGTRDVEKLRAWAGDHDGVHIESVPEAARFGDIIVLAVKGSAAKDAVRLATAELLQGKIVIDATNPVADMPPEQGVLKFFTSLDSSLMEALQAEIPAARFVKAFSSVGAQSFIDPFFPEGKPTMFICGDDDGAKHTVIDLLADFGWEAADMGGVIAARAIEPLCMLWCIPGFRSNEWTHAFKLLRKE
jgi:predicted dinucleotide-binding enzyme